MAWILIIVGILLVGFVAYQWFFGYVLDSGSVISRIQSLNREKYSPNMGRFAASKEKKAASARADLAQELRFEMESVVKMSDGQINAQNAAFDLEHNPARLDLNYQLEVASHETLLEQNELTRQLIGKAAEQNLDVATYLELKKKTEMDRLDLQKQWVEAEQKLKAGFIYQLRAHQHLALMTEYIGKLYDRAHQLQAEGKDREYKLIEEHIEFMEGDFRGRQRLLQATQQADVSGSDEDSDTGTDLG